MTSPNPEGAGSSAEPSPGAATPLKTLQAKPTDAARDELALALATRAVDDPLFPGLGQRCARCGERLGRPKKDEPGHADTLPGSTVPKSLANECTRCGVTLRSAEAGKELVPAGGAFVELFRGVLYVPRGLFCLLFSPRLWPYAIIPLLLNVVALALGWYLADQIVEPWFKGFIDAWDKLGGVWAYLKWGLKLLDWAFTILIFPLIAFLMVCPPFNIVYKLMFMPVMEVMTEATERIVLGFKDEGGFNLTRLYANVVVGIIDAVLLTLFQFAVMLLLLPFNFIPVVGTIFWGIFMPAAFASMDYTDINLVRRGYTTREKVNLWRAYQWRFFGYGAAFFIFISLPLFNAFVIPAAAAGGALLYLELERK